MRSREGAEVALAGLPSNDHLNLYLDLFIGFLSVGFLADCGLLELCFLQYLQVLEQYWLVFAELMDRWMDGWMRQCRNQV